MASGSFKVVRNDKTNLFALAESGPDELQKFQKLFDESFRNKYHCVIHPCRLNGGI